MATKVIRTKGFPKYTKTKKIYEKRNLNLNPNLKHENKNKNMKWVKQVQTIYFFGSNIWKNEQEMK